MGRLVQVGCGIAFDEPMAAGPEELEQIFRDGGALAQMFPGYVPRAGQQELARAVAHALATGTHLLAEAPCGIGKGVAYLVPGIQDYLARVAVRGPRSSNDDDDDREPALTVVTANIALQEQLVGKDLPGLQRVLPPFTFALLKGRQNYACHVQVDDVRRMHAAGQDPPDQRRQVEAILAWLDGDVVTGDRSELDFEPAPEVWRRFSMSTEDCPGKDCDFYRECHAYRAQRRAREASDVVVTNYHMLCADIAQGGRLLPHGPVVLDEAHALPDVARTVLGGRTSVLHAYGAVRAASKALARGTVDVDRWQNVARGVFERLSAHAKSPGYHARIRTPGVLEAESLVSALDGWSSACATILEERGASIPPVVRVALKIASRRCAGVSVLLRLTDTLNDQYVYFVDTPPDTSLPYLVVQRLDVAPVLRQHLFSRPSVVATSATLETNGGMGFIAAEIGAPTETTAHLTVPSPFDFRRQALLVIPHDLPVDPNSDEFRVAMPAVLRQVVLAAHGRTLALFTSYRNLNLAAQALKDVPYRVLRQGDAPRTLLVEEFRRDVSSVLLGTTSLWAGVDVPGEALSVVFIDKLPFPTRDDPVLDAWAERDPDGWFMKRSLPQAVIALKQGFGRLVRTRDDRGLVVLCDQRVRTKFYGRVFVRSLPPVTISRDLQDVARFLA